MVRTLEATVMLPAPVLVEVAAPAPSPKVRFAKVQPVAPPKLPVPSKRKVPSVRFINPLPVTLPPMTERFFVPDKVPAVIVKLPLEVALVTKDQPPPEPLKIRSSKLLPPASIV